jgi:hypothetical protein
LVSVIDLMRVFLGKGQQAWVIEREKGAEAGWGNWRYFGNKPKILTLASVSETGCFISAGGGPDIGEGRLTGCGGRIAIRRRQRGSR